MLELGDGVRVSPGCVTVHREPAHENGLTSSSECDITPFPLDLASCGIHRYSS